MNSEIVVCVSKRVYYRTATNRGIAIRKTLGPQVGSRAAEETGTVEGEREGSRGQGLIEKGSAIVVQLQSEGSDFSLFTPRW